MPRQPKTHCVNGHALSEDNVYRIPKYPTRRQCRTCRSKYIKEYNARTPRTWEANNRERVRRNWLKNKYGLTPEQYEVGVSNGCEICGTTERRIEADHDHETGAFRGFLCTSCNTSLGKFGDDPVRLRKAAKYLERHGNIRDDAIISEYTTSLPAGFGSVE